MKLYRRKDDGKIVGTQKDSGPASNRQDFEVPTDKQGLIDFLNLNLQQDVQQDVALMKSHSDYTLEDFSTWLHIQAEKDDLIKGLCEAVTQFKNDRKETEDMIKELDND